MQHPFSRTQRLLGKAGLEKLKAARVILFGVGGVGSFTAEALARSGVGTIELVDDDTVCITNINRQIMATHATIGKRKAEVMKDRILEINPEANVVVHPCFFTKETADQFDFSAYSYVIDAIDTVSSKLLLAELATATHTPIISCMGTGNKLDPTRFTVTDIYQTSGCPLARVMRRELRKRGISHLKVVYSEEEARVPILEDEAMEAEDICPPSDTRPGTVRRQAPGSIAFVPSVAGMILAGEVICDLAGVPNR